MLANNVESEVENKPDDDIHEKYVSDIQSYWDEKWEDLRKTEDLSGLSKNQQKKLLKKKVFMETRMERRKKERERKKIKRAEKKEAGLPLPESRRSKKKKKYQFSNYKVVIDLDFYDLMNARDLRMVLKQVKACYSENRQHEHPLQLCITSFDKELKDLFIKLQPGLINWDLRMEGPSYLHVFEKEKIVYLTSDSENILETLEEDKLYIIGGLVDHNHQKGLCYKRAQENMIAHAQLPIDQFVKMSSRKVLTINHVFEILLAYSETKDWKDAFFKVLPNRKGVSELCEKSCEENDEDDSEGISDDSCDDSPIEIGDNSTNCKDDNCTDTSRLINDNRQCTNCKEIDLHNGRHVEEKGTTSFGDSCDEKDIETDNCTNDGNEGTSSVYKEKIT